MFAAMRLYFIRHAQSANNALWDLTGAEHGRSDDPELSALGVQQARALGDFLERGNDPLEREASAGAVYGYPSKINTSGNDPLKRQNSANLTHLYTSPMTRAVQTALEVARGTGLTPQIWEDWHESGGIWLEKDGVRVGLEGQNRSYFQQRFSSVALPDEFAVQGWWSRAYENDIERFPRARRVWAELLTRHGGTADRVAVVSHGHFYSCVMAIALGLPSLEGVFFVLNNTGITRLDHRENLHQTTNLIYANRLDHLEPTLVT